MFKLKTILTTITLVFLLFSNQSFAWFMSEDPVGAQTHIQNGNIQGFNRYGYSNNNPYKFIDPDRRTATPFSMMRNQQRISQIKTANPSFHQSATFAQDVAVMGAAAVVSPVAAMSMEVAAISAGEVPLTPASAINAVKLDKQLASQSQLTELAACIAEQTQGMVVTGQLTWLSCNGRAINDISALSVFDNLQGLDISGTQVTDLSPLFGLTQLQQIYIDNTPISEQSQIDQLIANGVNVFGQPTQGALLSELTFIDPELQACVEEYSMGMTHTSQLTNLGCYNYQNISDLSDINQLEYLQYFSVDGDQAITGFTALAQIPTLQNLDIWSSSFSDSDLAAFNGHLALRYLSLGNTALTSLTAVADIPNLNSLWLNGSTVYDLSPLAGLSALSSLGINSENIADMLALQNLATLTELYLWGDVSSSDVSIIAALNGLQHIEVSGNQTLGNAEFTQLVNGLPSLISLSISYTQLSDISAIEGNLPNLQHLYIRFTNVTDLSPLFGRAALLSVDIQQAPILDTTQIDQLIADGVNVYGTPVGGTLLSELVNNDAELAACIAEQTQGMVVTGQLTWLSCNGRAINDISALSVFDNLQGLDISGTQVTDLSPLFGLTQLQQIYIDNTPISEQSQIDQLIANGVQIIGVPTP